MSREIHELLSLEGEATTCLRTMVGELLYKNQLLRARLQESNTKLRRMEDLLFRSGPQSFCCHQSASLMAIIQAAYLAQNEEEADA